MLLAITFLLYKNATMQSSAMMGGILQSVGQVVASGKLINSQITDMATIF